jgi:putative flippase GtrA
MEMKWISIAVAALAAIVLGYVWNNFIFKNTDENTTENKLSQPVFLLIAYVLNLVIAYGLHGQIIGLHKYIASLKASAGEVIESPFFHGAFHGASNSLKYGIISVLIITALLNGKEVKWILGTVLYWVLAITLMGGIVGLLG